jgi:thioester reductase-like protein
LLTAALSDALDRRVRVVSGDLTRHELGLRHETWDALAGTVGSVVHNGALVNYVQSYDALRPHNVDGTRELLRFAATGVLKSFHFVSSTFIHGWSAKKILWEGDDNAAMADLDFGYAQTKWVAEQLVLASGRQGLDVQVFRPSLLSASRDGAGSAGDIAVRLLAFMIANGLAPEAENQLSFLPADVAAHNIAAIVASGTRSSVPLHVTVDAYYSMVDVTREISRTHGYAFRYLPIPEFVAEMNRRAGRGDPIFPLLDFFNRSHPKIEAMREKRYNNDAYRDARDASGRGRSDPSLTETVSYLMAFMLREGLIAPPAVASQFASSE